ncbi:hypothetical protein Pcinc_043530, partial [Petrolisthes cinctipes]
FVNKVIFNCYQEQLLCYPDVLKLEYTVRDGSISFNEVFEIHNNEEVEEMASAGNYTSPVYDYDRQWPSLHRGIIII